MDKIRIRNYPQRNALFACWGCSDAYGWTAAGGFKCPRYENPQALYAIRVFGTCPHNNNIVNTGKAGKVRVGQQKQRKRR